MRSHVLLLFFCSISVFVSGQQTDSVLFKNTLTVQYDYFHFDKQFSNDWHIAGLEYKHDAKKAAFLTRFNYANRLAKNGWQAEVEAYPRFSKKVYSYLGVGYSANMPVFPKFRAGYSLYINLPKAVELEGGFRYLYFDRTLLIGVAGVVYYTGNWFLQLRSFLSDNNGFNFAGMFTARRYFGEMNDYAWAQIGTGVSPDETRNIQFTTNQRLFSNRFTLGIRKSIWKKHLLLLHMGYSRDEYQVKTFGNQYTGSIGYARRF
jgi:YaiO family outer membrane protein